MPKDPLSVQKIHDLLARRQRGQSVRQIAQGVGLSRSTVQDYLSRAGAAGIDTADQLPETDAEENAAFGLGTSDLHHIALDRLEGE